MVDRIPVIAGCTATGKTSLAFKLAKLHPSIEIVNADSRQLYTGMNIGTAKSNKGELSEITHHLLDVSSPDVLLSAGWFRERAMKVIEEILSRNAIPLVVGGSALYIMSLAGMLDALPGRNEPLRRSLNEIEDIVPDSLHRILEALDRKEADRTAATDRVRLIRALEIALLSNSLPSLLKKGGEPDPRFQILLLEEDNTVLRKRIKKRTAIMIENGLVEEVKQLLKQGFKREPVLGATIGYAEVLDYLEGKCTLLEAQSKIETNTWKYARKQRNIFRRLPNAVSATDNLNGANKILFGEESDG